MSKSFHNHNDLSDIDSIISKLYDNNLPSETELAFICKKVIEVQQKEDVIIKVSSPITICGDIHGQFFDLQEIFNMAGPCPWTNYLFLGDYVDRGFNSIKVISQLLALKSRFPDKIFLIRGNHESREINRFYGFYDECITTFGSVNVWKAFNSVYEYLPLAAIVNNESFCVHGGLSPDLTSLSQIYDLERTADIPLDGPLCDLLWSDPNTKKFSEDYLESPRGAGYLFGLNVTKAFQHDNKLKEIIRAHQLCMKGYEEVHDSKCLTIFSAPNYLLRSQNLGAYQNMDKSGNKTVETFCENPERFEPRVEVKVPKFFI